ncbi:MAG: glycosyltransferase family 1 protein [Terracidiphilus sp.]
MRIALNLLYLIPTEFGGGETYARGLLCGLADCQGADEIFVYVNKSARDWPLPENGTFRKSICSISGRRRIIRYLYEQLVFPVLLLRDRIDVVHSLGNVSPLLAPCSAVVTISDLYFKHFAKNMSFFRLAALRFFVSLSARRSDQIITVSEFSRRELCREFPSAEKKITVTHLATQHRPAFHNSHYVDDTFRIGSPYFVAFSSESVHKNIEKLIEAYTYARNHDGLLHKLVILGKPIQNAPEVEGIAYTGYLSDSTLLTILGGASFLIFPSLYEGFGLPLLEAMAIGVPVACSTAGSLPEVAGDSALLFCPTSPLAIRSALVRMSTDGELRDLLRSKGYENLKRFSWQKTAAETYRVLKLASTRIPQK